MPEAWSNKDERQYEHIRENELERGVPEDRAEEIAARTVNKRRRQEGRTRGKRTQGTGNPNADLSDLTRDELYNRAKEQGVRGRSAMSKTELIAALS